MAEYAEQVPVDEVEDYLDRIADLLDDLHGQGTQAARLKVKTARDFLKDGLRDADEAVHPRYLKKSSHYLEEAARRASLKGRITLKGRIRDVGEDMNDRHADFLDWGDADG